MQGRGVAISSEKAHTDKILWELGKSKEAPSALLGKKRFRRKQNHMQSSQVSGERLGRV